MPARAQQVKSRYCCRATTFYFNQAEVREAVHADPVQDAGFFTFGNYRVDYTYDFFNTIPLNQELINSGTPPPPPPRQPSGLSLVFRAHVPVHCGKKRTSSTARKLPETSPCFTEPQIAHPCQEVGCSALTGSALCPGVRMTIYSGDHDGIEGVPWPGSQTWTTLVGEQLGGWFPDLP